MENYKTIKEVSNITGLKYDYIRKCLNVLQEIFEPYIKRGNNNSILFDDNAIVLFDRVKQLKESKFSLEVIKEKLKHKANINPSQSHPNQTQSESIEIVLKDLREVTKEALDAKDETIQTQKSHIQALESKILLITDGKDPERFKEEQKELEQKKRDIFFQIKNLEGKWFVSKKRTELIQKLECLI